MKLAERCGFTFTLADRDDAVPMLFFTAYCREKGLPETTVPAAAVWVCCCHPATKGVYAVAGFHRLENGSIEVSDFYIWPTFQGKKAAMALIEFIKHEADAHGLSLVVVTGIDNAKMRKAIETFFPIVASHVAYGYTGTHGSSIADLSGPRRDREPRLCQHGEEQREGG